MPETNFENKMEHYQLKTSINSNTKESQKTTEQRLQEYIIDTAKNKVPSIVTALLENASIMQLAKHDILHRGNKAKSIRNHTYWTIKFCKWAGTTPDDLIKKCKNAECSPKPEGIAEIERMLENYAFYLRERKLSNNSIKNAIYAVTLFFRCNYINLQFYPRTRGPVQYEDRAPTIEELRQLLNMASLRERLIISMLATSGFREGTLSELKYRHVKKDFEKGIVPIHIHVEAGINKGKNNSYDTFLNNESAQYLKAYLYERQIGTDKLPSEQINDESPLVRMHWKKVQPMTVGAISQKIHKLCFQAGILIKKSGTRRYEFNPHSFRKFFRTQMAFLGVEKEYIEYMIGHKTDTYFDAEMKGLEYLRHIYQQSGISIGLQPEIQKVTLIKELILKLGLNPQEILKDDITNQNQLL